MKKSIKYAGIAAATLLAVAPVAAPVVSTVSTTTVKAANISEVTDKTKLSIQFTADGKNIGDKPVSANAEGVVNVPEGYTVDGKTTVTIDPADTAFVDNGDGTFTKTVEATADVETPATNEVTDDNITTAINSLKGLFTDVTYGDNSSNGAYPDGLSNAQYDAYDTAANVLGYDLLNGKTISSTDKAVLSDENANAQVKFYAVDSNGNKINFNDYTSLINAVKADNGAITYKYTIKYNNTDGDAQTPVTGQFTLTNDNNYTEVKTLNVTYTDPLNVAYGSKTVNAKLSSTIDAVVKDQNGNTVEQDNDATTTKAGALYKSLKGAIAHDSSDTFTDSTFGNEDKTYYQPVTITIKGNKLGTDSQGNAVTAQSVLNDYLAGDDDYNVTVNGTQLSALANKTLIASDANTLTFIRKVQVAQSASWTTEDVKGVVTTKTDSNYYTLKNNDNETITNRALAKNTPWVTDQKRTDQNGNIQYRVATGEWIDANDVTFSDKTDNGEGSYTDVKAINGKVTLDGPNSFVYFLYDDNGVQLKNRAVNGDSAWYTDKQAVNADGTVVYRVATGEWLQAGSGAHYSAY